MLKTCIVGASGYTGMELALLLEQHPEFELAKLFVSQNSDDANKSMGQLDARFLVQGFQAEDKKLTPLNDDLISQLSHQFDLIFLATPHQFSHDVMPQLLSGKAKVFDLSGAFRLKSQSVFEKAYGFTHQQEEALSQAQYGLAEWYADDIVQSKLVAVPGCYPTATLLALKPLFNCKLVNDSVLPIVNATSGVSGAGRKATMTNSLCEVSLQAYGVHTHRHQPEIASQVENPVLFTPHLGNFKRGILATCALQLTQGVTTQDVNNAYEEAYSQQGVVKLVEHWPKLQAVVGTPNCHLHWQLSEENQYLVVTSAIDNLLKGAASQALQCANLASGLDMNTSLEAWT